MEKIIFDTDIGDDIDDAVALRFVLKCKEIETLGVTTAYKNAHQRAKIASAIVKECGKKVPVYSGVDLPAVCRPEQLNGEQIGSDGKVRLVQYFDFMEEEKVEPLSAVDFILNTAEKYPGEVTLLSLAPLCNLAAAYEKAPEKFGKLKHIVMMGGCFAYPFAEWNIRCDVEAACSVFTCPVGISAVGYDITQNTTLTDKQTDELFAIKAAQVLQKRLGAYICNQKCGKVTMHDPLTAASLVKDFVSYKKCRVKVVAEGADRGKTVESCDGKEINVAVKADIDGFMEYLFKTIGG